MLDEELPQPRGRDLPGSAAQRRTLGFAAAILIALALGAKALTAHDHSPRAAVPTRSFITSATPRGLSPTWEVSDPGVIVAFPSDLQCSTADQALNCRTADEVSADFRAAVRAAFPGADETSVHAVVISRADGAGRQLRFARVTARAGRIEILVQVMRSLAGTGPDFTGDDGRRVVVYRTHRAAGGYLVQVLISAAPSGRSPLLAQAARLVADPRLLVAP